MGVAGHDVVKYALDTYATDNGPSLSCTHDANAWPSERFAGLPAPRADERVILWVQNSHAVPIPAGAMALDRMGAEAPVAIDVEIAPVRQPPARRRGLTSRACTGRRRSSCAPGATWCGRATRWCATGARASRTSMSSAAT